MEIYPHVGLKLNIGKHFSAKSKNNKADTASSHSKGQPSDVTDDEVQEFHDAVESQEPAELDSSEVVANPMVPKKAADTIASKEMNTSEMKNKQHNPRDELKEARWEFDQKNMRAAMLDGHKSCLYDPLGSAIPSVCPETAIHPKFDHDKTSLNNRQGKSYTFTNSGPKAEAKAVKRERKYNLVQIKLDSKRRLYTVVSVSDRRHAKATTFDTSTEPKVTSNFECAKRPSVGSAPRPRVYSNRDMKIKQVAPKSRASRLALLVASNIQSK